MKKVCIVRSDWSCCRRVMDYLDLKRYAVANGFEAVPLSSIEEADYCMLVTCGSEEFSLQLSLDKLDEIRKFVPEKRILVLGCISKIIPDFRDNFEGLSVSPSEYGSMLDRCVLDMGIVNKICVPYSDLDHSGAGFQEFVPYFSDDHWMIYLETGCLGSCKYCRIRKAVGKLVSEPPEEIIESFKDGLRKGYSKFWFTGDDVGGYGLDIGMTFPELWLQLIKVGEQQEKPFFFDLRTIIDIKWITKYQDEILNIFRENSGKVLSFGFGIQSSIPRLLKLSNRFDGIQEVLSITKEIKRISPETFLTAHMIFGLPTETISETERNFDFIKDTSIDLFLCSKYSHMEGSEFYKEYSEDEADGSASFDHLLTLLKKSSLYYHELDKGGIIYVLKKPNPDYFVFDLTRGKGKK